jgi:competence protein ComEA
MDAPPISHMPPAPAAAAVTTNTAPVNGDSPRLSFPPPLSTALTVQPPAAGPIAVTRPPEVFAAWPRCAQLAGAFLFGALTMLLGVHALTYLRLGAEPSEIEGTATITYRVDLNEARRAELLQLPGIGPSLADRIEDYRRTSGGFRSVADLSNVQGVGPATLERLRPFVAVKTSDKQGTPKGPAMISQVGKSAGNKLAILTEPIDINHATLVELQKLPGIGPKMSQRIVDEREKRPFALVSDLRRVAGIGPKTLEKLKPYVAVK